MISGIFGQKTTPVTFFAGMALHAVPDEIVFASLAQHLVIEAGPFWYAVVGLGNGAMSRRGAQDWGYIPAQDLLERMIVLAIRLNKEVHQGGHWVVVANPENRIKALWRDRDGDLQFSVMRDEPWARERRTSPDDFIEQCSEAWGAWRDEMVHTLQVKPESTKKIAQGELPEAWKHIRDAFPKGGTDTAAGWVR